MVERDTFIALNKILQAGHTKKKRRPITLNYLIEEMLLGLSCFFVGRVVLLSELAPFGVVFFAVLLYKRYGGITTFVAVSLGLFTTGLGSIAFKYIFVMLLFTLLWFIATKKNMPWSTIKAAMAVFFCMATINGICYIKNGFLAYELLTGFLESVIAFVMVFIFSRATDVIKEQRRRRILSGEEIISISIAISLVIIGFWSKDIFGISLRSVLSVFTVLLSAAIGGAGVGASIGVTVGFMLSLTTTPDPVLMANLAACGLLAGIFKELGRAGSCIAFILTNSLMTYYINRSTFVILPFGEILIAAIIVMLLPKRFIDYLKQFLDYTYVKTRNQHYYVNRMQELIIGRLNEFSQVFHHLSAVFGRMTEKSSASGKEELLKLFDVIAEQVCSSCALYRSCWQRDFYNTYSNMFDILTICEMRGYIESDEMPENLVRKCLNLDSLMDTINSVYAAYRTNLEWQRRIGDCRQLVADQLGGISQVVTQLATEIDMEVKFKKELEESIHLELDRNGIRVREVLVLEKAGGSIEVNITKKSCVGKRECFKKVAPIVSRILGRSMSCLNRECIQAGRPECRLRLIESRKFEITTGVARKAKSGNTVCGDSYSFTPIKDGKYLLALSDGMGSGTRAQDESSAVISLMENFLEAGFEQAITIKTINSILMLRSRDEMYATADLCIIDLIDASMEFIKIGGVPSFIYHKGRVEIIKKSALPIGILEDVETDRVTTELNDGDIIILVTDGILDAFSAPGDAEKALASLIEDLNTSNPQEIADTIMDRAMTLSGKEAKDDMTVLAGRVWRPMN